MRFVRSILRWVASLLPGDPWAAAERMRDGGDAYQSGDLDAAIEQFTLAIRLDPNDSRHAYNRGIAFYARGNYDQAIDDFDAALLLDAKNLLAYSGRGLAFLAKRDYDRAIADFTVAIQIDPEDPGNFASRGVAKLRKRDFDGALADLTEAFQLEPTWAWALTTRGVAWSEKLFSGQCVDGKYQLDGPNLSIPVGSAARIAYENALVDLNAGLRLEPDYAYPVSCRAAVFHAVGEYEKAIADYTEAIRLSPNDRFAFVSRGHAWREIEEYAKAIADFEEAHRLDPDDLFAINGLAWLLGSALDESVRDGAHAVALAKECVAREPAVAVWMDTLAIALAESGDFAQAIACQEQAVQHASLPFEADMRRRLESFRAHRPYRQPKKVSGPF